jgi:CelD/BcsL family acetyltransferase involved in cellulose biosynthesis
MRDSLIRDGFPSLTTLDDATRHDGAPLTVEHGVAPVDVAPQWDALADAVGAPPFLRPRWFAAWERAFAPRGIELVTVRRGGRLAAVLPLLRRSRGLRGAANDHTPIFGAVVADRAAAGALAGALIERRRCVDFPYADPRAPEVAALGELAAAAGYRTSERGRLRQPYIDLDGSWAEYEASLDRKVRKEGARLRRRLGEHGSVTFEYDDGAEGLHEKLSEGFAIEGSGWKSERGTAIASCRATESFYRAIKNHRSNNKQ